MEKTTLQVINYKDIEEALWAEAHSGGVAAAVRA